MSKWYKVVLKPLEFYYFAKEVGSRSRNGLAVPYYVVSDECPPQTTLLGAMRYYTLRQNNALNLGQNEVKDYIGDASFSFGGSQTFGQIQKITPLLIEGMEGEIIIPCPMNIVKRENNIHIYTKGSADVQKSDECLDHICVKGEKLELLNNRLFYKTVKTRNNKSENEDALFKIEMKKLDKNYSFSFFIEVGDEFKVHKGKEIIFLGGNKSAFSIQLFEKESNCYDNQINEIGKAIWNTIKEDCFYGLSDIYVADSNSSISMPNFSKIKGQRNLISKNTNSSAERYGPSKFVTLFKAGTVFYKNQKQTDTHLETIGLNKILEIKKIEG